jgi:GT2 family glycosyltransferase
MNDAARPDATVVVAPRDAFAQTRRCLDTLLEMTPSPRRIVYVDGGSPPEVAAYLQERAREHDFALVRSDCLLTPNQARNLGLAYADTEWVAFVDNNALMESEWLEKLVASARDTGATVVTPLVCIGEAEQQRIHLSMGESRFVEEGGVRTFHEAHPFQNDPVPPVRAILTRQPCELFEFHTVLVRRDALTEVGPLDEELRSLLEHSDLGLLIHERGGTVWFEPSVSITYLPTPHLRGLDRTFFLARWSDDWNRRSAAHFVEKWGLADDDDTIRRTVEFGAWLRIRAYRPYRSPFTKLAARRGRVARPLIDRMSQARALRRYRRMVAASGPPSLLHRASWLGLAVDV